MSTDAKPSPSLTSSNKPTTTTSSSSSSSSSSSTQPSSASIDIPSSTTGGSDAFEPLAAPVVNPHITLRNWLIASAVILAFILLLLVANASESIPGSTVWLILFASLWGAMTLCCGMFKGAERCATYVREQELNGGYISTTGEVETSSTTTAAAAGGADSGAGDAKYQKL